MGWDKLCSNIEGQVFFDNFFFTTEQFDKLLRKDIYAYGTARPSR